MEKSFSLSDYKWEFEFTDSNGEAKEVKIGSRMLFNHWSLSGNFPECLRWKNQPFVIMKSKISGIGLFTGREKVFLDNDVIGFAFFKINSEGWFARDYKESILSTFVNDSVTPNMDTCITEEGIIFKTNRKIEPLTELTASYRRLIEMFPKDPGVKRMVKYW